MNCHRDRSHSLPGARRRQTTGLAVLGGVVLGLGCARWGSVGGHAQQPVATAPLVFDGVTVINVQQGRRLPAQRVVIVGNRIRTVGAMDAVQMPAGARVVDAHGKYLIPGLWDMHTHVNDHVDLLYPRFIANGVTGLREMAQRFPFGTDSFRVWQRQVAAGTQVGPRVFGPSADNVYLNNHDVLMNTSEAARHVIDLLKTAGIVFLKQHDDHMDRALFFAIAAEARRVGLPLVGHLPKDVTEIETSKLDFGHFMRHNREYR